MSYSMCDLFCGLGSFHLAAHTNDVEVTLACDIDPIARDVYEENFGLYPKSDVRELQNIKYYDIMCAGFPCQSFSVIGKQRGFDDPKNGDLFQHILRLVSLSRPRCIILENVKGLVTHQNGETFSSMLSALTQHGYHIKHKVLNALDFDLPQKRERLFIVCFARQADFGRFNFPCGNTERNVTVDKFIENNVEAKYYLSEKARNNQSLTQKSKEKQARSDSNGGNCVWYAQKGNKWTISNRVITLRACPSHNYITINGERRPTERELLRFQGFPETYDINACSGYRNAVRLIGNSIPVNVTTEIVKEVVTSMQ